MAEKYCSVRFKTGEELDEALAAAMGAAKVPVPCAADAGNALLVNETGNGFCFGKAAGQADWSALEGEKGHVQNRTHYKVVKMEPFEVDLWELSDAGVPYYDLSALVGEDFTIFQIREAALTREQLDGAQVKYTNSDSVGYGEVEYEAANSAVVSEMAGGTVEWYGYYTGRQSLAADLDFGTVLVIPVDLEIPGFGTIQKGTYLKPQKSSSLVRRWSFKNETVFPLSKDYIPPADVHFFNIVNWAGGTPYDTTEIPVSVGGVSEEFQINARLKNHIEQNKPVNIQLIINNDYANSAFFLLHFPIREINGVYMEQVTYACELGVLFIEFKVKNSYLTIKVDTLANKLGLA